MAVEAAGLGCVRGCRFEALEGGGLAGDRWGAWRRAAWAGQPSRPIGTFREIWPGCFDRRAGFWGVFQQIPEIGSGAVWGGEIGGAT